MTSGFPDTEQRYAGLKIICDTEFYFSGNNVAFLKVYVGNQGNSWCIGLKRTVKSIYKDILKSRRRTGIKSRSSPVSTG